MSNNATIPDEFREEKVSLFIYDKYEGGLGYSEKIYDLIPEILASAVKMVSGCPCKDGCPACVGDYNLDKKMVLWGLENLLEESEPPVYLKKNIKEPQPVIRKEFSFFNPPDRSHDTAGYWSDFGGYPAPSAILHKIHFPSSGSACVLLY